MNVLVNGTTLNVTNAYAERDVSTGIITYYIILLQSEMNYYDLKELFKSNTEEIVKTDDDGNVELFANAKYVKTDDDDTNGLYTVILKTDENAHQLARNRQLEADKATLEGTVASKDMEISNLNSTISEKDKTIAEREEVITAKDVVISEKETTITEQKETITALEATVAEKDTEITAKDAEIAELLTIAEEYADMLYADALEEISGLESETLELPEAELEDLENTESEVQ